MKDHVRRGATLFTDVDVPKDTLDDGCILGDYHCVECDALIRLRSREGEYAYVRLGCECGAVELGLQLALEIDGDLDRDGITTWERRRQSEVFDDDY